MKKDSNKLFWGTLFISVLLILCASGMVSAQSKTKKIENLMQYCYNNNQFNGAVLIAENGEIIYHRVFGIANFDPLDSLRLDSQFRLGSVTKQFTAMAIMMLKEQDLLDYEDNIQKYLPELPYENITIRHLLTHTSGLPDYLTLFDQNWDTTTTNSSNKQIADNDDVIAMLATYKPDVFFSPGEKWQYSNTAYVLLAIIVARVSGEPFEEFLTKNIFNPLDMSRTLVYSAIRNDPMEHRVYGYRKSLNGSDYIATDFHYLNGVAGDGAIYSTTSDLFKWDRALYTDKLVSEATFEEAFTPVVLNNDSTYNYGFGWRIDTTKSGKKQVEHGGGWVGFRTFISRDIEENNTIIILTNDTNPYLRDIVESIELILHDESYTYPKISIGRVIGRTVINKGIDAALSLYKNLKQDKPDEYNFAERELNSLGYQLIQMNRLKDAIEIFKLNIDMFPDSFNPYDSLAEAYMLNGDTELAISNYRKSLELNPDNINATERLQKLKTEK